MVFIVCLRNKFPCLLCLFSKAMSRNIPKVMEVIFENFLLWIIFPVTGGCINPNETKVSLYYPRILVYWSQDDRKGFVFLYLYDFPIS
jgi:hypothetical protein